MKKLAVFLAALVVVGAAWRYAVECVVAKALANAEGTIPISEMEFKSVELPTFDGQFEWNTDWQENREAWRPAESEEWGQRE